jgi:hypothetical protein
MRLEMIAQGFAMLSCVAPAACSFEGANGHEPRRPAPRLDIRGPDGGVFELSARIGDEARLEVVVDNVGDGEAQSPTPVRLDGSPQWRVSPQEIPALGVGASASFEVVFTPSEEGPFRETVGFARPGPFTETFVGIALVPCLAIVQGSSGDVSGDDYMPGRDDVPPTPREVRFWWGGSHHLALVNCGGTTVTVGRVALEGDAGGLLELSGYDEPGAHERTRAVSLPIRLPAASSAQPISAGYLRIDFVGSQDDGAPDGAVLIIESDAPGVRHLELPVVVTGLD